MDRGPVVNGRRATLAVWLCSLSGCDASRPWPPADPGLERMIEQPRADSYEASRWFRDGKVMRPLPAGSLPYDRDAFRSDMLSAGDGYRGGVGIPTRLADLTYAETIPLPIDRELLRLGEERYQDFCGVCHGADGSGKSAVATVMTVRKPPSLHEPRIRAYPPGRLFTVISQGYGLMPSYALQLDVRGRWAVVAHVQQLQERRDSTTSQLPRTP